MRRIVSPIAVHLWSFRIPTAQQGRQKTIAAWLEEVVSREWQRTLPGLTIPSINLLQRNDVDGRISVGIAFKPLEPGAAIYTPPDTAAEIAQMLGRASEGRGAVTQVVGCDDGQRITITRKGNGIVVQIDNIDTDGTIDRYIVGMTPTLAREYATAIHQHAARIDIVRRSAVPTGAG